MINPQRVIAKLHKERARINRESPGDRVGGNDFVDGMAKGLLMALKIVSEVVAETKERAKRI